MAKKKRKLSKKNRNSISGVLVGLASIYAVSIYLDISREQLSGFFISSLLLFLTILALAVITVVVIKLLTAAIKKISSRKAQPDNDPASKLHPDKDKE